MSDDELRNTVDNLRQEGYLEDIKGLIPKADLMSLER